MGKKYCITCGTEIPEMSQFCPSCGTVVGQKKEESAEEKQYRMFREQQEYFYNQQKEQMENIQRQNEELKRQMQQMQQMNRPHKIISINALSLVAAILLILGLFLPFMSEGKELENDYVGISVQGKPAFSYKTLYQSEGTIFQWPNILDGSVDNIYRALGGETPIDEGVFLGGLIFVILVIVLIVDAFKPVKLLKGFFTTVVLVLIIGSAISYNDQAIEEFNMTLSCAVGFYTMIISVVLAYLSFFIGRKKQKVMANSLT